jgi:Tfp pilus assembly PilM family ATPase
MAKTLTKLASFLRPLGGGSDDLVAVKLHRRSITVAEVRHNSNVINIDNVASAPLPRELQVNRLQRQHDMIADILRSMREQGLCSAQDAGIIIPSGIVTLRQINLPFTTPTELANDGKEPDFWAEVEPDIAKLEDPFISYHVLLSSEHDDLTRVVVGYTEMAILRPWVDLLLSAHLNPVHIELEQVALANYLYASLPPDERRQSQAILYASVDRIEIIAFQPTRFHTIKLEISDFDQILLAEIEDVDQPTGDFWDEVGGRVANTLKQAILFLQEEQDFAPFSLIHVATDSLRARNFMTLLDQHVSIVPLVLWDPTASAEMALPVERLFSDVQNKSGFASTFGLALRKLGTFGDPGAGLIRLSMLPQANSLRRNRQLGVVSKSLVKALVVSIIVIGGWTGGIVLPAFLESQTGSRGYETIKLEAAATEQRIASLTTTLEKLDTELSSLSSLGSPRGKSIILNTLPDLVPEGVELSSYNLSDNTSITLKGSATNQDAILLFVTELMNSGLLNAPVASEPIRRENSLFLDFEITGLLSQES